LGLLGTQDKNGFARKKVKKFGFVQRRRGKIQKSKESRKKKEKKRYFPINTKTDVKNDEDGEKDECI